MTEESKSKIKIIAWASLAVVLGIGVPALGAQLVVMASGKMFGPNTLVMVASKDQVSSLKATVPLQPSPLPKSPTEAIRVSTAGDVAALSQSKIDQDLLRRIEESLPKKTALHVHSQSFLVADFETGEKVLGKDTGKVLPIASVTKLVTALVAQDVFKPNQLLTVSESAAAVGGTTGGLTAGEKISVSDLMHALLMQSGNDAAETLAEGFGRDEFIARMNQKVKKLGTRNTHFDDPTGLSNGNVSTVEDLLKISQQLFKHETDLAAITRLKTFKGKLHTWTNATKFLALPEYVGGKTGYTTQAGRTAVSIFDVEPVPFEKRRIVVIILKSEARDQDILTILEHIHKSPFLLSRAI